jgi:hypothetical protein
MAKIPEGELYARLYALKEVAQVESTAFRNRVAAYFFHNFFEYESSFCMHVRQAIEQEIGVIFHDNYSSTFNKFFTSGNIVDVLSAITLIWRLLNVFSRRHDADGWFHFVGRALREENLTYKLDPKCGIHPSVDQEFDRNRTSSLACLSEPRYKAVEHALRQSFEELEKLPMNGKTAARDVFEAAESMVKMMLGKGASLDAALVNRELKPICDRLFTTDAQVKSTAGRLVSGFANWVDALHPYRHGHDRDAPLVLPDDLAVLAVSQGASFIRWLVDLDRKNQPATK